VIITLTPIEKFAKKLMHLMIEKEKESGEYFSLLTDWAKLKIDICSDLKIDPQKDEEILKELEKHKCETEFSFEKLFFVSESIKRQHKTKMSI
jgi:hypothetical protein